MIINSTLTAFALDPDEENLPVIGWHNVVTATGVTSTTEADGYPASNLANPATHLLWRGDITASDEYLTVATGYSSNVDYVAVARHNFASAGIVCAVEGSTNLTTWTELVEDTTFTSDDSIIFRFQPGVYSGIRLRITQGVAQPEAAVLYVGKLLVMERSIKIDAPHTPFPLGQITRTVTGMSESGNFLGRIILSRKAISTADFSYITPTWYRENMQEVVEGAQEDPFFFAWDPGEYPEETGFAWLAEDAIPEVDPVTRRVSIQLKMEGLRGQPTVILPVPSFLEVETSAYQTAIVAAGGVLEDPALAAVDNFVVAGKAAGWWDKIIDASMCVGSNLAASLVKIIVAPGTSASLSNNGPFLEADYSEVGGIGNLTNTTKHLGTGVIPSAQSMDINDMAIAIESLEDGNTSAIAGSALIDFLISDNPAAGDPNIFVNSTSLGRGGSQGSANHGLDGSTVQVVSNTASNSLKGFLDNILTLHGNVSPAITPTTELTILRGKVSASFVFGRAKVGAYFIFDEGLTDVEARSFSLALLTFSRAVRTQAFADKLLILGDSIAMGILVTEAESWASIVSTALGVERINHGISDVPLEVLGGYFAPHVVPLITDYTDGADLGASTVIVDIGANDAQFVGVTPSGTFQDALEEICTFYRFQGAEVLLTSLSWTGSALDDVELYRDACQAAAENVQGVIFSDIYQAFVDTGTPDTYFIEANPNGFHPNALGHALMAETILVSLGVFDPLDAAPDIWLDPSDLSTLWQDAGATVPVTADGDLVMLIQDKSGNGNHFLADSAGARPTYRVHAPSGVARLVFDGTNDRMTGVTDTGNYLTSTEFDVVISAKSAATAEFVFSIDGGQYLGVWINDGGGTRSNIRDTTPAFFTVGNTQMLGAGLRGVMHFRLDGGFVTQRIDERIDTPLAMANPILAGFATEPGVLGGRTTAIAMSFYGMFARKTVFTTSHIQGLMGYLHDKCTIPIRNVGAPTEVKVIITAGESNAGGLVPLSSATAAELAPRPDTLILNNSNFQFEVLDVGTNNFIGHAGHADNNSFGIEVGLANIQEDTGAYGQFLYLIKNGQGGSLASGWGATYVDSSGYLNPFALRWKAAIDYFEDNDLSPTVYVMWTQGINDYFNSSLGTWVGYTETTLREIREILRDETVQIFLTQFNTGYVYGTTINALYTDVLADSQFNFMLLSGTASVDVTTTHWNRDGFATLAQLLTEATLNGPATNA